MGSLMRGVIVRKRKGVSIVLLPSGGSITTEQPFSIGDKVVVGYEGNKIVHIWTVKELRKMGPKSLPPNEDGDSWEFQDQEEADHFQEDMDSIDCDEEVDRLINKLK